MAQVLPPISTSPERPPFFPRASVDNPHRSDLSATCGPSFIEDDSIRNDLKRHSYSSPSLSSLSSQAETNFSRSSSARSTPASSLSLDTRLDDDDDDDLSFPSYNYDVPKPSSQTSIKASDDTSPDLCRDDSADATTPTNTSPPSSPSLPAIVDDTAVHEEPSLQVDYLSHDWREEDIWCSWKHIVSRRKVHGEYSRLENASWRTWSKVKYQLRTVSPETLNWLKDCDVTWLYGPLQQSALSREESSESASRISKSNSFLNKKPILKKRSVSEAMLQKSLSSSSLVRQAAEAVNAQRNGLTGDDNGRRAHRRTPSDFLLSGAQSKAGSRADYSEDMSSLITSVPQSPDEQSKRHIRFDNTVEQCIAVDFKESAVVVEQETHEYPFPEQESSDDDMIEIKAKPKKRTSPTSSRNSFSQESKGIAMLPSTTLKSHQEGPTAPLQSPKPFSQSWRPKLSNSASQETLRPANPSQNFLIDNDEEADLTWEPSVAFSGSDSRSDSESDREGESSGNLRRTPSGMFMPFDDEEEGEQGYASTGFFGRIVDTVNTARDIGHVIWNVGWRK